VQQRRATKSAGDDNVGAFTELSKISCNHTIAWVPVVRQRGWSVERAGSSMRLVKVWTVDLWARASLIPIAKTRHLGRRKRTRDADG
jgi:hypothetical protein